MSTPILPTPAATAQRGVAFTVHGTPIPQGSKSATVRGGVAVMFEDNKKTDAWRRTVARAGREAMNGALPLDGPLEVRITFRMPRGKTVKRVLPSVKPDVDKLVRAVFDSLTAAAVIADDARVIDLHARKVYAETPGADITVREAGAL